MRLIKLILAALLLLVLTMLVALPREATARDASVVREWRKTHPCPTTGKTTGACPDNVADHGVPLCLQPLWSVPLDAPWNLHWQAKADSYRKDVQERTACTKLGKLLSPTK